MILPSKIAAIRFAYVTITSLSLGFVGIACNNNQDCTGNTLSSNCETTRPDSGVVSITVSLENGVSAVPIALYQGKLKGNSEDVLLFRDTLYETKISYRMPADVFYSATARYRRGSDTLIAIDGERIDVSSSDDCGTTCYTISNASLDVRRR